MRVQGVTSLDPEDIKSKTDVTLLGLAEAILKLNRNT